MNRRADRISPRHNMFRIHMAGQICVYGFDACDALTENYAPGFRADRKLLYRRSRDRRSHGIRRTFRITFVISDTGKLYVLPIVGRTVITAPLAAT